MNRVQWLVIISLLFTMPVLGAEPCLKYEPEKISIPGVIKERIFPGPPNYEDIKKGDRLETAWILQLDRPVCVIPVDPKDDIDTPESNVKEMQLIIHDYKKYQALLGKRVVVRGSFTHSITGHHRTPVLIDVTDIITEGTQ